MYTIRMLPDFCTWLSGLKDGATRRRLARRLERAEVGNFGDAKSVGRGVFEMREFFGPGWRMYYTVREDVLIVMLAGGDKSTQSADIAHAICLAATIGEDGEIKDVES
jgi:putative addiction module killer protein